MPTTASTAKKSRAAKAINGSAPKKGAGRKAKATEFQPKPGDQQYLGGGTEATMAPKVIKPLVDLGRRHMDTKEQHAHYTTELENQAAEGLVMFNKYKEHFSKDEKGNFHYKAGGVELIIEIPKGDPKFKSKAAAEVDTSSNKNGGE